jgi:hypothetical protein
MTGSGLASAHACSIYRTAGTLAGYQTGSTACAADSRFVTTGGRHGERTSPGIRR